MLFFVFRFDVCFLISIFLQELRDRLVSHINEIGQKEGKDRDRKLKEMLSKSFPLVRVKALRPVVMCILRNTTHIDDKYLRILVRFICKIFI